MDYTKPLKYHFRPRSGWINDPNGLVYFQGYYHVFYQHAPHYEVPWKEPMHWGHARTRDFLEWEELPLALCPDSPYDAGGCWSGTAIVKDDILYLFYASVLPPLDGKHRTQTVSIAYSHDGIHFEKYSGNPVIDTYPADGSEDFRDPALCCIDGAYYCVMATGHPETQTARLLLYKSDDLISWQYKGVMCQWEGGRFAECPSLMNTEDGQLLTASVCRPDHTHHFSIMYGKLCDSVFTPQYLGEVDKGPDQYAGQAFSDHLGRQLLLAWIPGWKYKGWADKDVGCMSLPRQLTLKDGKIYGYPPAQLQHLLTDSDPAVQMTEDGFVIERQGRSPVIHKGEVRRLEMLRDEYILEVFVNGGEDIYSVLL